MELQTVNLEAGMPTTDVARNRLSQALRSARASRAKAVKVIHGYGSTGKGGAIKTETHRFLQQKKREGFIKDYVRGEDFTPFQPQGRKALDLCPSLSRDRDYSRGNPGITIVLF